MNNTQLQTLSVQSSLISIQEIYQLSETFASSGIFGSTPKTAAECVVKMLAGRELGIPPFSAVKELYLIKGKLSFSANLIATLIQQSRRFSYKVIELSNVACEIRFFEGQTLAGISRFSLEDAMLAGLSTNSEVWRKYPRNMLFARALTNGARWFCPGIFAGHAVYAPEELGATVDQDGNVTAMPQADRLLNNIVDTKVNNPVIESLSKMRDRLLELQVAFDLPQTFDNLSLTELKAFVKPYANLLKESLLAKYEELYALADSSVDVAIPKADFSTATLQEINQEYEALKARFSAL